MIHFLLIILSVFSVFALGFVIGKRVQLDIRSLSFVAINVFFPILVFLAFYETPLTRNHLNIFIAIGSLYILLYLSIVIISRLTGSSRKRKHAMVLSGLFMNGGNYGVPVVLFALGQDGYVYALMIMVMMDLVMNTFGVYIAASGGDDHVSFKSSLIKTIKMPVLLASFLGIFFQVAGVPLPYLLIDTMTLLSQAAIPLIMIVLGIQLSTIKAKKMEWTPVGLVAGLRLLISPLFMIGIISLMGLLGTMLGTVLLIISAMPSAANTTMFSLQFNVDPDFVSLLTLLTTTLSLITLPLLFLFL
ncbi:AEC family transporter [Halalkalibacter alkaliphilus]